MISVQAIGIGTERDRDPVACPEGPTATVAMRTGRKQDPALDDKEAGHTAHTSQAKTNVTHESPHE
jgi:hypothetical protein